MEVEDLKSRLLSGGSWVFANKFLSGIFFIARTAILARLLSPSEFGTAGLALAAVGTISIFTNSGFHQAIVQKKEDVAKDLDTAWVVSVSRGIFSFAAIFLLAPYIAVFFKSDGLSTVIQVIGLDFIFRGLINPGTIYFQRELNFKKVLILNACEYGCAGLVAVVWALFSPSVWALVVSVPAGSAASAFCSFLIHPYRPRLKFDLGRARNLFRFGRWVFFGNVIFYFIFQLDSIVIGRILGDKALGFYQMSSRVASLPATHITQMTSPLTFPMYARLQDKPAHLQKAYLELFEILLFVLLPVSAFLFLYAREIIDIFLGSGWLSIETSFKILVGAALIRAIAGTGGSLFTGYGLPKLDFYMNFLRFATLVVLAYPFTVTWGTEGFALCVFFSLVTTLPLWWFGVRKVLRVKNWTLLRSFFFPAAVTIGVVIPLEVIRRWVMETAGINLFLMGAIYLMVYSLTIIVLEFMGVATVLGGLYKFIYPQVLGITKHFKKI